MKELDDMTPEELRAWADANKEESRRRFAGQPVPRISRVKREDYPHWHLRTWLSEVADGWPAQVRREGGQGPVTDATMRGLRAVTDNLPHALLVEVSGLPGVWGLRAPRMAWVRDIEVPAETVRIEVMDEPVIAWRLSDGEIPDPERRVPAPSDPEEWTLRTTNLEEAP
ncbi:MAG: hypothetical protein ACRDOY_11455 [Nocardioidaceae bacterium]